MGDAAAVDAQLGNLSKKGADRGLDSNIYFGKTSRAIVSVKAGATVGACPDRGKASVQWTLAPVRRLKRKRKARGVEIARTSQSGRGRPGGRENRVRPPEGPPRPDLPRVKSGGTRGAAGASCLGQ